MIDSIEQFKKEAKLFGETQSNYRKRAETFQNWKNQFQQLEQEVPQLINFFEKKYEESAINHGLIEEVKAKLENRREGVRLSVKSASRLLRKLNPEKPLEDHTEAFITSEEMSEKLRQVSAQYSAQEEHLGGETVTEGSRLEEENKVSEDSENIDAGEADTVLPVSTVSNKEGTDESVDEVFIMEEKSAEPLVEQTVDQTAESGAEQPRDQTAELINSQMEDQKSAEEVFLNEEKTAEQTQEQEVSEEGLKQLKEKIMLIQEAFENNQEVLQQIDEDIRAAEKRFITFIEKGVAPVLDGLYSGEKYGKDLVEELTTAGSENIAQVEEWLNIYNTLMGEVKSFLRKFLVGFFSSEIGELFDETKHEPIGVVEDSQFGDEQIKEVVRYGLTFENSLFDDTPYLIRPAQVIVVKNKKQETFDEQRGNQDEI